MKKVVNIETAPGKFVPTLVDANHPLAQEAPVEVKEEIKEEKPKRKRATRKKKED